MKAIVFQEKNGCSITAKLTEVELCLDDFASEAEKECFRTELGRCFRQIWKNEAPVTVVFETD